MLGKTSAEYRQTDRRFAVHLRFRSSRVSGGERCAKLKLTGRVDRDYSIDGRHPKACRRASSGLSKIKHMVSYNFYPDIHGRTSSQSQENRLLFDRLDSCKIDMLCGVQDPMHCTHLSSSSVANPKGTLVA